MPPHCDTMDGPVVKAARRALEERNVNLVLPWVPAGSEGELAEAFEKALRVRKAGTEASELADYWFFETAVRLHRHGERAPYTGLKPAGLDEGPVVPRAEAALETGDPGEVVRFVQHTVEEALLDRFERAAAKKRYDENDVVAAREYVQAMLGFVLFSHELYTFVKRGVEHGEAAGAVRDGHEH